MAKKDLSTATCWGTIFREPSLDARSWTLLAGEPNFSGFHPISHMHPHILEDDKFKSCFMKVPRDSLHRTAQKSQTSQALCVGQPQTLKCPWISSSKLKLLRFKGIAAREVHNPENSRNFCTEKLKSCNFQMFFAIASPSSHDYQRCLCGRAPNHKNTQWFCTISKASLLDNHEC